MKLKSDYIWRQIWKNFNDFSKFRDQDIRNNTGAKLADLITNKFVDMFEPIKNTKDEPKTI